LTPLVIGSLLRLPDATLPAPDGAVDRALACIRTHTNAEGAVGRTCGDADDYPNYATALAVDVMVTARRGTWSRDIAPMIAQLRAQQFSEANGWTPDHAAYGGWGMGGPIHRPPDAGHVDLSMTRFRNANGRVKEDDPLIATAFAIHVLTRQQHAAERTSAA
jgi:hypothetical protein